MSPTNGGLLFIMKRLSTAILGSNAALQRSVSRRREATLCATLTKRHGLFCLCKRIRNRRFTRAHSTANVLRFSQSFVPVIPNRTSGSHRILATPTTFRAIRVNNLHPFGRCAPNLIRRPCFRRSVIRKSLPRYNLPTSPDSCTTATAPHLTRCLLVRACPSQIIFNCHGANSLPNCTMRSGPTTCAI